jgi:hypothetical protein
VIGQPLQDGIGEDHVKRARVGPGFNGRDFEAGAGQPLTGGRNHVGRAIESGYCGSGVTNLQQLGGVAGSAAEIDGTRDGRRWDSGEQIVDRPVAFVFKFAVLGGRPGHDERFTNNSRLARQPSVLFRGQGHHGQAALADQWRLGKEVLFFNRGERVRLLQAMADFDFDERSFRVGGIDADYGGGTDGLALVTGMVDNELIAGLHFAQMTDGGRVSDAVPDSFVVALETREGIGLGLRFQQVAQS